MVDEKKVLVEISKLVITVENHGGYQSVKCVVCGRHGWKHKIEHEQDCPIAATSGEHLTDAPGDEFTPQIQRMYDGNDLSGLAKAADSAIRKVWQLEG